jgi:hypothetical protein
MGQLLKNTIRGAALLPAALLAGAAAYAQDADIEARLAALEEGVAGSASAYVDNSYLFLIGGIIVMLMAAGFCMLEAGLVRSKNAAMQSTKNVALYSIAGLMFWVVGYNMAYPAESIGGLRLVLPDGVCRNSCVHRIRYSGRAREAMAFPDLHRNSYCFHLSGRRVLGMGCRLPRFRMGLL